MLLITRLLKVLLGLGIVTLGVWFTSENNEPIALVLLGFAMPPLKLGLWVLGALLLGVLLGVSVGALPALRAASKIKRQARLLDKQKDEISRLREAANND